MVFKVAILGSGPNGYAAAKAVIDSSKQISRELELHVFDFGDKDATIKPRRESRFNFRPVKPSSSQLLIHAAPKIFGVRSSLKYNLYGSSNFGGWSQVWGSTFLPYPYQDLENLGLSNAEIERAMSSLIFSKHITNSQSSPPFFPSLNQDHNCKRYLPNYNWKIAENFNDEIRDYYAFPSQLGIHDFNQNIEIGCNQCGLCNFGCPKNHIWNAKSEWTYLSINNNITFHNNIFVQSIESEVDFRVKVNYLNLQTGPNSDSFEKLFIALGPIQSPSLLLRSGISRPIIRVFESRMMIVPFFLRSKFNGYENMRISLSDYFLIRVNQDKKNLFAQVYLPSISLNKLLKNQLLLLRFIPEFILRLLLKRIGFALIFFPSKSDEFISLKLSKENEVIISSNMKSSILDSRKRYASMFLKNFNLFPLTFLSLFPKAGQSYHLGGSFSDLNDENRIYISRAAELRAIKNAYLTDSSILQQIGPWPITFTSMIKAYTVVMKALRNL